MNSIGQIKMDDLHGTFSPENISRPEPISVILFFYDGTIPLANK